MFDLLKGLDEKYFMYVEDVDFCFRAKKLGFPTYYVPNAKITHFDEGRTKPKRGFKAINMRKGMTIFFTKYKSRYYCIIWETILRIESFSRPAFKNIP